MYVYVYSHTYILTHTHTYTERVIKFLLIVWEEAFVFSISDWLIHSEWVLKLLSSGFLALTRYLNSSKFVRNSDLWMINFSDFN